MNCLHLLLSANRDVLQQCLQYMHADDGLLLVDDGVNLLREPMLSTAGDEYNVHISLADMQSRGLQSADLASSFKAVDDQGLVALVKHYPHTMSWK